MCVMGQSRASITTSLWMDTDVNDSPPFHILQMESIIAPKTLAFSPASENLQILMKTRHKQGMKKKR